MEELIQELEKVCVEQKRLADIEEILWLMRSIAIEATTCEDDKRVTLQEQFHELKNQLIYFETEKREAFR